MLARRHHRSGLWRSGEDRYARLAAEVDVVHHLAAIYDLAVPGDGRPPGQRRGHRQRARLLPGRRAPRAGSTTSAPPTSPATAPASSTSTSSTAARASRTTTSRPSSRPRSGSAAPLDRIPTTIFRPAIVVGDSRTGETQKFDGPYYALRVHLARPQRSGMPVANIGRGATPFNVVPVDFIVDSMVELGALGGRDRRDRPPLRPRAAQLGREMFELLTELYGAKRASYRVPPRRRRRGAAPRPGARFLRRHPGGVDPLPQPPGPLRHPPRRRAPGRLGAALPALLRVRAGDGRPTSASTSSTPRWRPPRRRGNRRPGRGVRTRSAQGAHRAMSEIKPQRYKDERPPEILDEFHESLAQPRPDLRLRDRPARHHADLAEHLPDPADRGRQRPRERPGDPRRQPLLELRPLPRRRLAAAEDPLHGEVADVPPEPDPRPDLQVRRRLPDPPRPRRRRGLRDRPRDPPERRLRDDLLRGRAVADRRPRRGRSRASARPRSRAASRSSRSRSTARRGSAAGSKLRFPKITIRYGEPISFPVVAERRPASSSSSARGRSSPTSGEMYEELERDGRDAVIKRVREGAARAELLVELLRPSSSAPGRARAGSPPADRCARTAGARAASAARGACRPAAAAPRRPRAASSV